MRIYLVAVFCFFSTLLSAQHSLRLEVTSPGNDDDSVFIAGDFNGWNPSATPLKKLSDRTFVFERDNLPADYFNFKFTNGSWARVETALHGADIQNRQIKLGADTSVKLKIDAWRAAGASSVKRKTASKHVVLMDTAFQMSSLDRKRKIWLYLPPGYEVGTKRYPVIYMHDGQNLFDESQSGFGEWGIDETLDSLINAGKPGAIVVGIENGPRRLNEYNPYFFERAGAGEGDAYLSFIMQELKPFIDKNYRTLKTKENTIIAGSSMGGLISYYAALKHDDVFGRAGVFSPAFWTAPGIIALTDSLAPETKGMFFFYMGEKEGEKMMHLMNDVVATLGKSSRALIYNITDESGSHNEAAWRKWFAEFYLWITSNGLNRIIR